jgi:hypothetical protein
MDDSKKTMLNALKSKLDVISSQQLGLFKIEDPNLSTEESYQILMKHKIIEKRDQARGYSSYKESEEYKNKINK